jgi:hypothetical protein
MIVDAVRVRVGVPDGHVFRKVLRVQACTPPRYRILVVDGCDVVDITWKAVCESQGPWPFRPATLCNSRVLCIYLQTHARRFVLHLSRCST